MPETELSLKMLPTSSLWLIDLCFGHGFGWATASLDVERFLDGLAVPKTFEAGCCMGNVGRRNSHSVGSARSSFGAATFEQEGGHTTLEESLEHVVMTGHPIVKLHEDQACCDVVLPASTYLQLS